MIEKRNLLVILLLSQFLMPRTSLSQKLSVGDIAPTFEVFTTNGDLISLEKLKGQKIYLAFFRYVGCPVCNFRVHELIENYESIKSQGYIIIAVFESTNATLIDYLNASPVPFTIIGNPELNIYKMYGVEKSFLKMIGSAFKKQNKESMKRGKRLYTKNYKKDGQLARIPADFLIDKNGIIKLAYYGKNIGDHLPLSEIIKN